MKKLIKLGIIFVLFICSKVYALDINSVDINTSVNYIGPSEYQPFEDDSMEKYKITVKYKVHYNSDTDINELHLDLGDFDEEIVTNSNYEYDNGSFKNISSGNNVIEFETEKIIECSQKDCYILYFRSEDETNYKYNINSNERIEASNNTICSSFVSRNETDKNILIDSTCKYASIHIINKDYVKTPIYNGNKSKHIKFNTDVYSICFITICILLTFIYSYVKIKKHVRSKNVKNYDLDNIYPLEASFIYYKGSKIDGVEAPLYDAARLKYIEFIEKDDVIYVKKLKDYNGDDYTIDITMNYVFNSSDNVAFSDIDFKELYRRLVREVRSRNAIVTLGITDRKSPALNIVMFCMLLFLGNMFLFFPYGEKMLEMSVIISIPPLAFPYIISLYITICNNKYAEKGIDILLLLIYVVIVYLVSTRYDISTMTSIEFLVLLMCLYLSASICRDLSVDSSKIRSPYTNITAYRKFLVNLNKTNYDKEMASDKEFFNKLLPYAVSLDTHDIIVHNVKDIGNPKYFKSSKKFSKFIIDKHIHARDSYKKENGIKIFASIIIAIFLLFLGLLILFSGFLITGIILLGISGTLLFNSFKRM